MSAFFENVSNFFSWISETLLTFVEYFLSFMDSLFLGINMMMSAIPWAVGIVGYMPNVLAASLVAVITVYSIKFLIGR